MSEKLDIDLFDRNISSLLRKLKNIRNSNKYFWQRIFIFGHIVLLTCLICYLKVDQRCECRCVWNNIKDVCKLLTATSIILNTFKPICIYLMLQSAFLAWNLKDECVTRKKRATLFLDSHSYLTFLRVVNWKTGINEKTHKSTSHCRFYL